MNRASLTLDGFLLGFLTDDSNKTDEERAFDRTPAGMVEFLKTTKYNMMTDMDTYSRMRPTDHVTLQCRNGHTRHLTSRLLLNWRWNFAHRLNMCKQCDDEDAVAQIRVGISEWTL